MFQETPPKIKLTFSIFLMCVTALFFNGAFLRARGHLFMKRLFASRRAWVHHSNPCFRVSLRAVKACTRKEKKNKTRLPVRHALFVDSLPNHLVQTGFAGARKKNGKKANKINAGVFTRTEELSFVRYEQGHAHGDHQGHGGKPCEQSENDECRTKKFGKQNERVGSRRADAEGIGELGRLLGKVLQFVKAVLNHD